jgi:hypothetical protein
MTEFTETLRRYCRNPRCRSKLPSPVSNLREAFCCGGCYNSFYLHRCLVCERPMVRKAEHQKLCGKRKCRNDFRVLSDLGRYYDAPNVSRPSKNVDFIDPKEAPKPYRPWRIVAGPELTRRQLRSATVGAEEAIEAINRTNARHWRETNAKAKQRCSIKRDDMPVNVVGGYKFRDAPVIDFAAIPQSSRSVIQAVSTDQSLDIPEFLRRMSPRAAPLRLAA